MNDNEKITALGSILSKKYANSLLKLLIDYKSISASEASSRLDLHVQTVQDFFETTTSVGLTSKEEVYERKRPYFRYILKKTEFTLQFNLDQLFTETDKSNSDETGYLKIRERKNSKTHFTLARSGNSFSSIIILSGTGRESQQRKINLSPTQGVFLFHLPFPDAHPLPISEIMNKAGIEAEYQSEIDNLIQELIQLKIVDSSN